MQLIGKRLLFKPRFSFCFVLFSPSPEKEEGGSGVRVAKPSYWDGGKENYAYFSKAMAPQLSPLPVLPTVTRFCGRVQHDGPSCPLLLKQHCNYNDTDIIVAESVFSNSCIEISNLHIIKSTHLKDTSQWLLVFAELCSHHHVPSPQKGALYPWAVTPHFTPNPPAAGNHQPAFCLYRFAYGHFT